MTRGLLLALALSIVGPTVLLAQTVTVSGTVVDTSNAVVPGATLVLTGPAVRETAVSDARGAYELRAVPPGSYQLAVSLSGFSPVSRNLLVSSADVVVPALVLAIAPTAETVVVTASKVETSLANAPATMTVLGKDVLTSTPSQNFGDLLRSVPGMNVVQTSARDINLTAREATSTLATSQLALLDGRSIYLDFFGLILWDFVPSNLDDIKQIEVVRGPASAVWGANALSGVVNIITKSPREAPGTTVVFGAGAMDRDAGSTVGQGAGALVNGSVSTSQIVNNRWSYRLSAGYFHADPYPRPTGQIPIITDPRDPSGTATVGGAFYPLDSNGPIGTAFQNKGTTQPKFDVRVDQDGSDAHLTYAAGISGTSGTIYTGIGPFDIQPGSVLAYGKVNYSRGALKINAFTNIVDGEAPNLLLPNPLTGRPLQLDFKTQTYDAEIGHTKVVGRRHSVSYGGNYRRNNFDITLAPAAQGRNELGGYVQDEIFAGRFRFWLGGRVDKFGNIEDPFFSPRLTAMYQLTPGHSLRFSFNRAFRSPSVVNNYLDVSVVTPVDLRGLSPLLPPQLRPLVASPFPLLVHAVGSELPIGASSQASLEPESLTAWETAYLGTFREKTTLGAAFYINDLNRSINFAQLAPTLDPYTAANPPPGWALPPEVLTSMAQAGIFLPRTGFTYLNLGPLRQKGLELSVDHRFNRTVTAFANYSWQGKPEILADAHPYPTTELALPPTNRFNLGGAYNSPRYVASLTVNYADKAFWSDVLTSPYAGYTQSYVLTNGMFGIKWQNGRITTSVKSTNIFNRTIQEHVFGDLLRRSVLGEVRFRV
jgi:outer membrane receptor protein involved in Fe transport